MKNNHRKNKQSENLYRGPYGQPIDEADLIEWIDDWDEGEYGPLFLKDFQPLTQKICDAAFKRYCTIIDDIPEQFISREMCIEVVSDGGGHNLRLIPKTFINYELCKMAIENSDRLAVLEFVPAEFKTLDLCVLAIKTNSKNRTFVPEAIRERADSIITEYQNKIKLDSLSDKDFQH